MTDGLDNLTGAIGDTLKTAPTLYEDAFQSTTQESGKVLALIPRAINAALLPLRQWITEREYKQAETEKLLAQKLEHVGEDKIVTPEAYVAVPAIQAISYSMDSEVLRNLYANLLAKAMNSDTKDLVHPAFVEIIKQLSPIDVYILEEISSMDSIQVVSIYCSKYPSPKSDIYDSPIEKRGFECLTHIIDYSPETVRVTIDNLLRLRLIEERVRFRDPVNEKMKMSPFYITISENLKKLMDDDTWKYEENTHVLCMTKLGVSFRNFCLD